MEIGYFFDSYAIIELLKENPAYAIFKEEKINITIFNLAEIYWHFLLENEETAESVYKKFRDSVTEIDDETIKDAMKFRKKHKNRDLSYTDCIGYIYAIKNNLIFLTGDKEFENIPNVKFVK